MLVLLKSGTPNSCWEACPISEISFLQLVRSTSVLSSAGVFPFAEYSIFRGLQLLVCLVVLVVLEEEVCSFFFLVGSCKRLSFPHVCPRMCLGCY